MKKRLRIVLAILGITIAGLAGLAVLEYREFTAVPRSRLGAGMRHASAPGDDRLHSIELPLDHRSALPELHAQGAAAGTFVGYFRVSETFAPRSPVVFVLTDGQQPLVGPDGLHPRLACELVGFPYVVIGHRGHEPLLFPEVYRTDGSLDHGRALRLYSSWQQVEDIERVRHEMARRGWLPADGKVMLYGVSGGGVLVQQYLARYGANVSRALMESTGAPDLARKLSCGSRSRFIQALAAASPGLPGELDRVLSGGAVDRLSLLFLLQKLPYEHLDAWDLERELIHELASGSRSRYRRFWITPPLNFPLVSFSIMVPSMDATRVRMFELLGEALLAYRPDADHLDPLLDWTGHVLSDFVERARNGRDPARFELGAPRSAFKGEVLVVSGRRDHVYSPEEGRSLAAAYPASRWTLFDDVHRPIRDPEYRRAIRRAFFSGGLASRELEALLADRRQLDRR